MSIPVMEAHSGAFRSIPVVIRTDVILKFRCIHTNVMIADTRDAVTPPTYNTLETSDNANLIGRLKWSITL